MLLLAGVGLKLPSGFGRDRDINLAIWCRHVSYVVVFVFVEFVDT